MISHNNKKRTWHRAAALLLSASLLLTACGAQNNNDNIFSPILPDNSPASSTDPDDKLPDPVTIVVEDDSVAPPREWCAVVSPMNGWMPMLLPRVLLLS